METTFRNVLVRNGPENVPPKLEGTLEIKKNWKGEKFAKFALDYLASKDHFVGYEDGWFIVSFIGTPEGAEKTRLILREALQSAADMFNACAIFNRIDSSPKTP